MKLTFIEPRSPREFAEALEYYRRHRAAHPLPQGWSDDVSGLEAATQDVEGNRDPEPLVRFTTDRCCGLLSITMDLYFPVKAAVFICDYSAHGCGRLSPREFSELLFALVGIDVDPIKLERSDQDLTTPPGSGQPVAGESAQESDPPTTTTPDQSSSDDFWTQDLFFTYPPANHRANDPTTASEFAGAARITRIPR